MAVLSRPVQANLITDGGLVLSVQARQQALAAYAAMQHQIRTQVFQALHHGG